MLLTTRIRVVLEGSPERWISGVRVALYDRDLDDEDDLLGEEVTNEVGEILFSYDSGLYMDAEDQDQWRIDSLPDLYVVVYDDQGKVVLTTRPQTLMDNLPRLITVEVSRDLAEKYSLLE